jgi:hypothetical protein
MNRDEMVELRRRLIRGDPPYEEVDLMGRPKRDKSGVPGLDELKAMGDYGAGASGIRLALETELRIIDHLLEKMR